MLDGRSDVRSLYIEDSREKKYSSYNHELTDPMLLVQSGHTNELSIKFYSSYTSNKSIEYMFFSDIVIYDGQLTEKKEIRINI